MNKGNRDVNELLKHAIQDDEALSYELKAEMWSNIERRVVATRMSTKYRTTNHFSGVLAGIGTAAVLVCLVFGGKYILTHRTVTSTTAGQPPATVTTTHTTSPITDSQLTKSDMKIGNLYIGQELTNVQSIYGEPSTKSIVHGNGAPQWIYNKLAFAVGGSPVFTIAVFEGFSGGTPRGIHVGSTVEEVKKAYPTYKTVQGGSQLFVQSPDKKYSIDFVMKNDKVIQVTMNNETP